MPRDDEPISTRSANPVNPPASPPGSPLSAATAAASGADASAAVDPFALVAPSDQPPKTYVEALSAIPTPLLSLRNLLIFHMPLALEKQGLHHAAWVFAHWLFGGPPPYPMTPRPPGHRPSSNNPAETERVCIGNTRDLPVYRFPMEALESSNLFNRARASLRSLHGKRLQLSLHHLEKGDKICRPLAGPCPTIDFQQWRDDSWGCFRRQLEKLELQQTTAFGQVRPTYPELPLARVTITGLATALSAATGATDRDAAFGAMTLTSYVTGQATRRSPSTVRLVFEKHFLRAHDVFRFDRQGGQPLGCWSTEFGLSLMDSALHSLGLRSRDETCLHDHDLLAFRAGFRDHYNRLVSQHRGRQSQGYGSTIPSLETQDFFLLSESALAGLETHIVEVQVPQR